MSAGTAVLASLGDDNWNADLFGALSSASRLSSLIKNRSQVFQLALTVRKVNKIVRSALDEMYDIMEGKRTVVAADEPVTPEKIDQALRTLHMLEALLEDIYKKAKQVGLTNNSLVAGPLSNFPRYVEELNDFTEWVHLVTTHSGELDNVFERAKQERERGEIYDLSEV